MALLVQKIAERKNVVKIRFDYFKTKTQEVRNFFCGFHNAEVMSVFKTFNIM